MLKLLVLVLVELVIGVSAAGVLVAVGVPIMVQHHWISPGGLAGSCVVVTALLGGMAVTLFRPGSALHRYGRRE